MNIIMKCPVCEQELSSVFQKLSAKKSICISCNSEFSINKKWKFFALFVPIMTSAQLHGIPLSSKFWVLPLLALLGFAIILIAPLNQNEKNS